MNVRTSFACLALIAAQSAFSAEIALPAKIEFNRDVRPILADKCFACHGFDAKKREAELRLDTAEGATADHDGHQAIAPGNLSASTLWKRITTGDADERMPPVETNKTLSEREVAVLKRWIEQGAPYQKHWSFEVPQPAKLPVDAGLLEAIDEAAEAHGLTRSAFIASAAREKITRGA